MTPGRGARAAATLTLPADGRFIDAAAQRIVADCSELVPDLSAIQVVVARPELAPPLRLALATAARRTLLLPHIATLEDLAQFATTRFEPDSRRAAAVYAALKQRRWFERGALWRLCEELLELFDELTERAVTLPADCDEFAARLAAAYRCRADAPLQFEARLVHELWHAEGTAAPGRRAAMLLALSAWAQGARSPLFAVWDGAPLPWQSAFFDACAQTAAATVLVPVRGAAPADAMTPTDRLLHAAWPAAGGEALPGLHRRAQVLADSLAESQAESPVTSPLAGRLEFVAADTLEDHAAAVAGAVRGWLAQGLSGIALVAADRVAARRVRALLERDGVLVADETGWKLDTTRAAALIDAWLEVLASGAYYRDLLDLMKSSFIFGDVDADVRRQAALELEHCILRHGVVGGWARLLEVVDADRHPSARAALLRIGSAAAGMSLEIAPLSQWLQRLLEALAALGADLPLCADAAGSVLMDLLRQRREELAGDGLRVDFGEWREWLNHQFEHALFRDRGIDSPVVMTHLGAAYLRRFDAAVIIGADAQHLAPAVPRAIFVTQSVRRELGLATAEQAAARRRDELHYQVSAMPRLVVTWQRLQQGEAALLNPDLDILSLCHQLAFGDDLLRQAPRVHAAAAAAQAQTAMPRPVVPAQLLPTSISASALASLVACPYQFYARRVLGLEQPEDVREALEKRDYGELLHGILARFHRRFPTLAEHGDGELQASLLELTERAFAAPLRRNFFEHAWRARWRNRVPAYIAWQRARESAGWRFAVAEQQCEQVLDLGDGAPLTLHGRLDRVDRAAAGAEQAAVLDYKTQTRQALRERVADPDRDVQLAFYTLLLGDGVAQAGYVALDEEPVDAVYLDDPPRQARQQAARLAAVFAAMRAGSALPANGSGRACDWCEMAGLCRKPYHDESEDVAP